jgi:hypothetical protein
MVSVTFHRKQKRHPDLSRSPPQQPYCQRVGNKHDDERTEERRQRPVDEIVLVEYGALRPSKSFADDWRRHGASDGFRGNGGGADTSIRVLQEISRSLNADDHQRAGDGDRDQPDAGDPDGDGGFGPAATGGQRTADCSIAVKRDGAHVHDGRRAQGDVGKLPRVAEDKAERPVSWITHTTSTTSQNNSNKRRSAINSNVAKSATNSCGNFDERFDEERVAYVYSCFGSTDIILTLLRCARLDTSHLEWSRQPISFGAR